MIRPFRILFVCTANICRSPLVEAAFRAQVIRAGLAARLEAASGAAWVLATSGFEHYAGKPADAGAVAAARRRGLDLSAHRARAVQPHDIAACDLVFGMERAHVRALQQLAGPAHTPRVGLFLDLVPGRAGEDVPDPYRGSAADFDHVLDLAEAGSAQLLDRLRAQWLL